MASCSHICPDKVHSNTVLRNRPIVALLKCGITSRAACPMLDFGQSRVHDFAPKLCLIWKSLNIFLFAWPDQNWIIFHELVITIRWFTLHHHFRRNWTRLRSVVFPESCSVGVLLKAYFGSLRCIIGRSVALFCTVFNPSFSSGWGFEFLSFHRIEARTEGSNRDFQVRFIVQVSDPRIGDAWNADSFSSILEKSVFTFGAFDSKNIIPVDGDFETWLIEVCLDRRQPAVSTILEFTASQPRRPPRPKWGNNADFKDAHSLFLSRHSYLPHHKTYHTYLLSSIFCESVDFLICSKRIFHRRFWSYCIFSKFQNNAGISLD